MSFLLMSDKIVGECEALYADGKCRNEARVEILSRDFYTSGMKVVVKFCFDCAKHAIEDGLFEPVIDVKGDTIEE